MPPNMNAWRKVIIDAVHSIADEGLQRRAWLDKGPEWDTPSEMFLGFLNDAAAEQFFARPDTGLTHDQLDAGRRLVQLMRELSDETPHDIDTKVDPAEFIDDPRLKECRAAASRFLALL